jgi:hypothetical protein
MQLPLLANRSSRDVQIMNCNHLARSLKVLGSRIWMKQYWEHLPEAMSDNMILLPKFVAKCQPVGQ